MDDKLDELQAEIADLKLESPTLEQTVARIPQLVKRDDVIQMINLQVTSIERLESTNKSLANCNSMAQDRLAATTKLFKKTSKQMNEAKKDLDVIYKKILEMKNKIRIERPDLFEAGGAVSRR